MKSHGSEFIEASRHVCERVDWNHPSLAGVEAVERWRSGDAAAAAIALVRRLRERETPRFAASARRLAQLRAEASGSEIDAARDRIARGMAIERSDVWGLVMPMYYLAPLDLALAATADTFALNAEHVLEARANWGKWRWSTLFSIENSLHAVWEMRECADEHVVPVLAWMLSQAEGEWNQAKHWGEPSLGTSAHNWWLIEYLSFWYAGFMFPEFPTLSRFRPLAAEFIEREYRVLFEPDGYSREASISYHTATMDTAIGYMRRAQLNGEPLGDAFVRRLRESAGLEWRWIAPDGSAPPFGDHGNGMARPGVQVERLRSLAAMFDLGEGKWVAERFKATVTGTTPAARGVVSALAHAPLTEDTRTAYERVAPVPPRELDYAMPRAGLYFIRSSWARDADYMAIEATPKGMIDSSHGHTTLLNFVLFARGTPVLIDSGGGWETDAPHNKEFWTSGSFSHNVVTIDGEHHLPIRGGFRWDQVVTPLVDDWVSRDDCAFFSGVHEAYERLPKRVSSSRRKVFHLRGKYWVLIDRFIPINAADEHVYTQHYQLGLKARLDAGGRVTTLGDAGNLLMVPVGASHGEAKLGPCPHPIEGYPNPDHLTYTSGIIGPATFAHVFVPFAGAAAPNVLVEQVAIASDDRLLAPHEGTALAISIDGRRDVFVCLHTKWSLAWRAGGCAGDARLFHSAVGPVRC